MAKTILYDCYVSVGGTDLSTSVTSVEWTDEAAEKDVTTFQGGGYEAVVGGLKKATVKINFLQDYAASSVQATLKPLFNTLATVTVRPASGTASATNPQKAAAFLISNLTFISGQVGDVPVQSLTWRSSGSVTDTP